MKQHCRDGFTLVELLVVIAIIAILATVVLSALNDARREGVDAKIQTEMDSIAKRAAVEFTTTGAYDTVCGSNGATQSDVIVRAITSINAVASGSVTCNSDTNAFAASVPFGVTHWCVDSEGARREIGVALGGSDFVCP